MAFSGDFLCNTFKAEVLQGLHNFTTTTGNSFKLALYDNTPSFDAGTTAYTSTNELASAGNYTTTGNELTNITPVLDTSTGIVDFADEVWSTATFTAYGGMIYNDTAAGDPAVCILDFGAAKTATAGDFTVQFPAATAAAAIIRIA